MTPRVLRFVGEVDRTAMRARNSESFHLWLRLQRRAAEGDHRLAEIAPGIERSPALPLIFPKKAELAKIGEVKVEVALGPGYAYIDDVDGTLVLSQDYLATGDKVGHVVVWELATGKQVTTLEVPVMYTWDPVQRRHSIGGIRSLSMLFAVVVTAYVVIAFMPEGPTAPTQGGWSLTELPRIEAHITEYQCPRVVCPDCGQTTQAQLPEPARGQFGPELTALLAYLTVVCRMPRRVALELLSQVLGIDLSLGSTQKAWEEVSAAVAECCGELEGQLRREPVLNSDETGYRTNGEKRWLWALVAKDFVFYTVALSRGAEVLVQLLGAVFAGILCSDRCPTYPKYHRGSIQFCWAHFKRNILGVLEIAKTTEVERFCRDALALHARLFRLWHRFRDGPEVRYGPLSRAQLIEKSIPLQKKFFALAQSYLDSSNKDVRNLATALFQHGDKFFTFLEKEGVEPTNNAAERALRAAVQWRKISFGSRSAQGEIAVARLLTVTRTCRMQNHNPLHFLARAVRQYRRAAPGPSLLSKPSTT